MSCTIPGARSNNYLLLSKDQGYFCTCYMLQNRGYACRHFFRVFKKEERLSYHITLIKRRWFQRKYVYKSPVDFRSIPFISNEVSDDCDQRPPDSEYMSSVLGLTPSRLEHDRPTEEELCRKEKFGNLVGRMKKVTNTAQDMGTEQVKMLDEAIQGVERILEKAMKGPKYVQDPVITAKTGRRTFKRLKSAAEDSRKKRRKGKHNS